MAGDEMESSLDNKDNGATSSNACGSGRSTASKSSTYNTREDEEGTNDPYAYLNRDDFTSEKFKIEIRGLPKFYGYGVLRKFLNEKLKLASTKLKPARRNPCVFVCFRNEEDRQMAIKTLNHLTWKGKKLSVSTAKPVPDPLVKKRKLEHEAGESEAKKKPKISEAEQLQNSTTPYWNLSYEEQLKKKHSYIKKVMCQLADQISSLNPMLRTWMGRQKSKYDGMACKLLDIRKSPICDGYRNKCEFTIGINEETKQRMVGFRLGSYVQGHVGVGPIDSLKHIPPRMKETVKVFEKFIQKSPREPFNPETHTGHWRQLTLRLTTTDELMVVVVTNFTGSTPEELASAKEEVKAFFESEEGKALNVNSLYFQAFGKREAGRELPMEHVMGAKHITESLLGLKFRISPEAFFQVNTLGAGVLFNAVAEMMELNPSTTVVDVCCGTGTIGLSLAKKCGQILGLEVVAPAIEDAKANAAENNITNCEFFTGKAEEILVSVLSRAKGTSVYAIVDPPRSGLQPKGVVALRGAKIDQVVYVSCDPNAAMKNFIDLARQMSKRYHGYPMVPVCAVPVDMFPHTAHCEVVILFHRIDPNNLPLPIPSQTTDVKILSESLSKNTEKSPKPSDSEKKKDDKNETTKDVKSSENPGGKANEKSHSHTRHVVRDEHSKQSSKDRHGHSQRSSTRGNMPQRSDREQSFSKNSRVNRRSDDRARSRSHDKVHSYLGARKREEFTCDQSFSRKHSMFEKSSVVEERAGLNKERSSRGDYRDGSYERSRVDDNSKFLRRSKLVDGRSRERSPQPWLDEMESSRKWKDDKLHSRRTRTPPKGERWSRQHREIHNPGVNQEMEANSRRNGRSRERRLQRSRSPLTKHRFDRRGDDDYPRNESRGREVRPRINEEEERWEMMKSREVVSPLFQGERNFAIEGDYVIRHERPCSSNGMHPFDVKEEWYSDRGVSPSDQHRRDNEFRRAGSFHDNVEDSDRYGRRNFDASPVQDRDTKPWGNEGIRRHSPSPVRRYQTYELERVSFGQRQVDDDDLDNRWNRNNVSGRCENEEKSRFEKNNYNDFEPERVDHLEKRNDRNSRERFARIEKEEILNDYHGRITELANEGTPYMESRTGMLFQERDLAIPKSFQPANKPLNCVGSYNETEAIPPVNYRGGRSSGFVEEREFLPNPSPPKQHLLDGLDSRFSLMQKENNVFRGSNEARMPCPSDLDRFRNQVGIPISHPVGAEKITPLSYSNPVESGGDYRKHCETNSLGRNFDSVDTPRRPKDEDMDVRRVEMVRRPMMGDGMMVDESGKPVITAEMLLITAKNHNYDRDQGEWRKLDECIPNKPYVHQLDTPQPKHWEMERPRELPNQFMESSSPMKNSGGVSNIHRKPVDDRYHEGWMMDRSNKEKPGWRDLDQASGVKPSLIRESHPGIPDADVPSFSFLKRDIDERCPNTIPPPLTHPRFPENPVKNDLEKSFSFRPSQPEFVPNSHTLQPIHHVPVAENSSRDFSRNQLSQPRHNESVPLNVTSNNFRQGVAFHDVSNTPSRPPPFLQNPSQQFLNSNVPEPRPSPGVMFKGNAPALNLGIVQSGPQEVPLLKPNSIPENMIGGPWNTRGINPWMANHQPLVQQKQW